MISVTILTLTVISTAILGLVAFLKNPKNQINRSFFIMIVWEIIWQVSNFLENENISSNLSELFLKIDFLSAVFFSYYWLMFTFYFPQLIVKKFNIIKYSTFILSLILAPLSFTTLIINNIHLSDGVIRFEEGSLWIFYAIIVFGFFVAGCINLLIKLRKLKGIERIQVSYVLFGFGLSALNALIINLFLFNIISAEQARIGIYGFIIFVICTAYAIIRYRLMDIRIIARKIFIYFGVAAFTYGLFYLVAWIYINIFGGVFSSGGYLAGIIIAPLFVATFYGIDRGLKIIANKYFFVSLYNYQETINKLSQELNYYNDLDKIISLIVDTIKQTMQLDRAGVLLINQSKNPLHYQIAKVIGFNEQNGISLVQDNFLTKYLQKTQKPLVRDELLLLARDARTKKDQESFSRLHQYMKRIEASLCLPLMSSNKLIGIIVLGAKISNDAYTKEDLELLNTLSYQAGIAVDNAKLYKEVQDFNKTLKQKVDEQTSEIRAKSKDIEEKNKYLQELLNMKTDFLRVVNHQLNTPLSIMRNAFAMVKEKVITPEKGFTSSDAGLERMSQTIADFWDAFELEGEKMKMNPEKTNIEQIVNNLIEEKKKMTLTQERQLTISVEKPKFSAKGGSQPEADTPLVYASGGKIPFVWCDPKKIVHVVSNLLDNAVFYTTKGSITISYEIVGVDYLKINVKDTGVGISQKNEKRLFQKFSRGEGSTSLHPDGSGLGLYVAKKIVEANDGEITFSSAGEGKGSTFSFAIPCYVNQKPTNTEPIKGNNNILTNIAKK